MLLQVLENLIQGEYLKMKSPLFYQFPGVVA